MNDVFDPARAQAVLEETLSAVLAEMAFIDCQAARGADASALPSLQHCVGIDVLKPVSFRIELRVNEDFRKRIVEMLFDGNAPEAELNGEEADLLLEILNVLAGNFISAYFGPDTQPKLELPRYLYFTDPADGSPVVESLLDAEGNPLTATIRSIRYRY